MDAGGCEFGGIVGVWVGGYQGEPHGEGGALSGFGFDFEGTAVGGDDAVADGEAQAGALADGLGGEEGVEDAFEDIGGDAGTGVLNFDAGRRDWRGRAGSGG